MFDLDQSSIHLIHFRKHSLIIKFHYNLVIQSVLSLIDIHTKLKNVPQSIYQFSIKHLWHLHVNITLHTKQ